MSMRGIHRRTYLLGVHDPVTHSVSAGNPLLEHIHHLFFNLGFLFFPINAALRLIPMKKSSLLVLAFLLFPLGVDAAPTALSPSTQKAAAPDLAINSRGEIAALWVDRSPQEQAGAGQDRHLAITDVYVAISRDGGESFDTPVKLNSTAGVVWGQQVSRPRISGTPNGTWHVSYAANDEHPVLKKTALTTHYTRSLDGGKSFESPRRLSSLTDQDMSSVIHGGFVSAAAFGTMTTAPDGSVHVFWIDTRHMNPDSNSGALYGTTSTDDGTTFGAEKQIIDTGVCPCCQLMAVANSRSDVFVGSRKVTPDNIRPSTVMYLAKKNSTPATRVEIDGAPWQISGCPLKPTVLAVHGKQVFAAAHNGGEAKPGVIFSVSDDNGRSFHSQGLIHPDAAVSDAPAIATNGKNVLVAWHAKLDGPRRVFYRIFDLKGAPQTPIREVDAPPGNAQSPVVVAGADGKYRIAWQQSDRIWMTSVDPI